MTFDELVDAMGKALDDAGQKNAADDEQLREIYQATAVLKAACEKEAQRRNIVLPSFSE